MGAAASVAVVGLLAGYLIAWFVDRLIELIA